MDSDPSFEPVEPFEHLTLTETAFCNHINPPLDVLHSRIDSSAYTSCSSTTDSLSLQNCRLISQSVELITTIFTHEDNTISSVSSAKSSEEPHSSSSTSFSSNANIDPLIELHSLQMLGSSVLESHTPVFQLDSSSTSMLVMSQPHEGLPESLPKVVITEDLDVINRCFPLDSIGTLATPTKFSGPFGVRPVFTSSLESHSPSSFIHRSVSSPIFASSSSSRELSESGDDSSATIILGGQSAKKPKKRKTISLNLKFPEPEPPAVRPRFQWYQGKGVVRVHLLVKNVLPTDLKITCTGRNLEFRCKADGCPYPPTRPEVPPRVLVEYHLPLRLPHRVHPEPEFVRLSPSKIEVYYRKLKPSVEWSCLWKSVTDSKGYSRFVADKRTNELEESSSESEDLDDSEEDEDRPAKRFMNGQLKTLPATSVKVVEDSHDLDTVFVNSGDLSSNQVPPPPLPVVYPSSFGPLTSKDENPQEPAVFTVGAWEMEVGCSVTETTAQHENGSTNKPLKNTDDEEWTSVSTDINFNCMASSERDSSGLSCETANTGSAGFAAVLEADQNSARSPEVEIENGATVSDKENE